MITYPSSAFSDEAANLQTELEAMNDWAEQPESYYGRVTIDAISALAHECKTNGWDGEDAIEISPFTVMRAINFIRALPYDFPLPECSAEPDGAIALDWIRSRNRTFSLSISSNNRLAYAWLNGINKGHSVHSFDCENIPSEILLQIREIMKQ